MRFAFVMLLVLTTPSVSAAGVYKNVQPDGTIVYSDRPAEGAEEIKLPELQTYTPAPIPESDTAGAARTEAGSESAGYKTVAISSPENDATLRDNAGNVSVNLRIEPPLKPNHTVDIRMDGKSIGKGRGSAVNLTNVDRGTHTLEAVIVDESGKEIGRTGSVVFHLNRASIRKKAPAPP